LEELDIGAYQVVLHNLEIIFSVLFIIFVLFLAETQHTLEKESKTPS
jgi:hypothetical protein